MGKSSRFDSGPARRIGPNSRARSPMPDQCTVHWCKRPPRLPLPPEAAYTLPLARSRARSEGADETEVNAHFRLVPGRRVGAAELPELTGRLEAEVAIDRVGEPERFADDGRIRRKSARQRDVAYPVHPVEAPDDVEVLHERLLELDERAVLGEEVSPLCRHAVFEE